MEDPTMAYEDMLFFERRLTEVISNMQPTVKKWRIILGMIFLSTIYNAYFWIFDPSIRIITFWESLLKHPCFTISFTVLLFLFLIFGVHKRVVAPKIIALRCRSVLADFCLSCDENGKLIVRPAQSINTGSHFQIQSSFSSNLNKKLCWQLKMDSLYRSSFLSSNNPITQVTPFDEYEFYKIGVNNEDRNSSIASSSTEGGLFLNSEIRSDVNSDASGDICDSGYLYKNS